MCRLTKFFHVKCLLKKWRLFENVNNLSLISATLRNICEKTGKTYLFLFIFSDSHFGFTCSQNFGISNLQAKSHLFQYVNKILLIPPTLNNIFDQNYEKSFNFCNIFLKFVSICTISPSFIMTTFLQQK